METKYKYWAAYLNMARYNLFKTLCHIGKTVNVFREQDIIDNNGKRIRKDQEEGIPFMAIMNEPLLPEQEAKVIALFNRHFPFIKYLHTVSEDDETLVTSLDEMRSIIKTFAWTLSEYRNRYSHFKFVDTREQSIIDKCLRTENKCGKNLWKLSTIATRSIKERYKSDKNSTQKGMLDQDSLLFLTNNRTVSSRGFDPNTRQYTRKTPNTSHFLYPLKSSTPARLSEFGLIQLTCLFLEKKYITEFLTQIRFLDRFSDSTIQPKLSERRIILEVLSVLRLRLPEKKITTEKDEFQIALDILNELKKCPQDLYELLEAKDKATFNVISSTGDTTLLTRQSDRFPQLALSWLDSTKAFDRIRFQVNAGDVRYIFNDSKKCLDGHTRKRILQEPLNCFARLGEVEKMRINKIKAQIATEDDETIIWPGYPIYPVVEDDNVIEKPYPHISNSRAHYVFDGANLGLSFEEYIPSIQIQDGTKISVPVKIADCTISTYELPALLFHLHLSRSSKKQVTSTEDLIYNTLQKYRRFFSDIYEGITGPSDKALISEKYGIKYDDLPNKIKDYLEGKNDSNRFAKYKAELVNKLIEDSQRRLKRLNDDIEKVRSDSNKPGRKSFVRLKPGAYASFLAQDIVYFQEATATEKLTGLNYAIMQSSVATFNENNGYAKEDLVHQFIASGLISKTHGKGTHPFLWEVIADNKVVNTISFYKSYLSNREKYLRSAIPDNAGFLHSDRIKWANRDVEFYKELAKRYLSQPIILPRQLFEDSIREMLLSLDGENANALREGINKGIKSGRCNCAYMIQEYMYDYMEDGTQKFYGFFEGDMSHENAFPFDSLVNKHKEMSKRLVNELKRDHSQSHKNYLSKISSAINCANTKPNTTVRSDLRYDDFKIILRNCYNKCTEAERRFRRYAIQDYVLFLSAMSTVKEALGTTALDAKLGDILPDSNKGILETSVTIKRPSPFPIEGESPILVQNNIKIKDSGEVFKIFRDSRLENLLSLHAGQEIDVERIKDELDIYDRSRVAVFDDIFEYERIVTKGKSDKELANDDGRIDFNSVLRADTTNNQVTKHTLRLIRNAFGHNSYPRSEAEETKTGTTIKLHAGEITGAAERIARKVRSIVENTTSNNT